jgi:hypothetical protein
MKDDKQNVIDAGANLPYKTINQKISLMRVWLSK